MLNRMKPEHFFMFTDIFLSIIISIYPPTTADYNPDNVSVEIELVSEIINFMHSISSLLRRTMMKFSNFQSFEFVMNQERDIR